MRDQVLELNAMCMTECFYNLEKKTKKAKNEDKGKESYNEEDMNVYQENDLIEEKVIA